MSLQLSVFILTRNSEKYLDAVLSQLKKACDDVLVVESRSTDSTVSIAKKNGARFLERDFDNFRDQRMWATEQCTHSWVLMVDSDEIPDDALIEALLRWKDAVPEAQAYRIPRTWYVLGKQIHAVYPVVSPDFPVRLFDKRVAGFKNSPVVHEEPSGYSTIQTLTGSLQHHTFETDEEIERKLEQYTDLSAQTLLKRKKDTGHLQQWLSSVAAFCKWYFAKGGWKDGMTGVRMGRYAFEYTFRKYEKARRLKQKTVDNIQ